MTLDLIAIAKTLNTLNQHDDYKFVIQDNKLLLECLDFESSFVELNPFNALMCMQSADEESRLYAMPGLVM